MQKRNSIASVHLRKWDMGRLYCVQSLDPRVIDGITPRVRREERMTYRGISRAVALGYLLLCMIGCERAPDPQKIGVFASTNRGLLELTSYGEQHSMTGYDLHKVVDAPKVTRLTSFYVNMPDSKITNSKIFWAPKLNSTFEEKDQPSLDADIETGKNNAYEIKCAAMDRSGDGYIFLKISMPLGTPDRMYVIQLSK